MCGIFGWIKWNGSFSESEINASRESLSSMKHRGPDFQGEWFSEAVYMGHRRLSIIDLSPEANQPFKDKNSSIILTFNGEIYNYLELKAKLKEHGIRFKTSSDTEVLLEAFKFYRERAFLRLNGMFSFAVYDRIAEKHYLVRDHLGQKPLYYYLYQDGLVYASELRALLSLKEFKWQLDKNNFLKFLTNSCYMWDTTPLQGVRKLLPGHYLEVKNGKVILEQYWDSLPGDKMVSWDFEEATSALRNMLDQSCRISLRADVPYGVFLSGGIDSTLVLESCHRIDPEISTFSVSMQESDFDEGSKAKSVTDFLGINSHYSCLMDSQSIEDAMDEFCSFSDEPHGDPGFVNSYFLAKFCKSSIKVALSGDGADELFAGYITFLALKKEKYLRYLPDNCIPWLEQMVRSFFSVNDSYVGLQFKTLAFLQGFPAHQNTRFPLWLGSVSPEDLQKLCPWQDKLFFSRKGEEGTLLEDFCKVLAKMGGKSCTQRFLYFYQKFFLPEFVCMHTDRAAMQCGLEVRSPFLSVSVIEFANSLPDNFKMSKGELKKMLRYAVQKRGLPQNICNQKKQGFTFPIARWLKTTLKTRMEEMVSSQIWDNGLIDRSYLNILKNQHIMNKRNNYRVLFNLMVFQKWLEKYSHVSVSS
jgi:asparagine synthase (glutamine-hydrolysing)